ncbi:MAG: hypothetical protein QE487_04270 [Fluviicola sp.]|nr:hypothetical protein [Fluviicola sp.]
MKLIGFSVLLLLLCRSDEVEDLRSVYSDMNAAKLEFLPFPVLRTALDDVRPPLILQKACKVVPLSDTRSFFSVLTRKMFRDSKKVIALHPGDLNADGIPDMLVLATRSPRKSESKHDVGQQGIEYRRVILFLQSKNGVYRMVTSNDHVVEDAHAAGAETGNSHHEISVLKGKIIFKSNYGSCDRTVITSTYVYDRARQYWYLKTILEEEYTCNSDKTPTRSIKIHATLTSKKYFGNVKF